MESRHIEKKDTGRMEERLRERWRINTGKDVGVLQGKIGR
jgi:hypothetical protein